MALNTCQFSFSRLTCQKCYHSVETRAAKQLSLTEDSYFIFEGQEQEILGLEEHLDFGPSSLC